MVLHTMQTSLSWELAQKVSEAGFTGLSTRTGDLLTIKFKYARPAAGGHIDDDRVADTMQIVLRSDAIQQIRSDGWQTSFVPTSFCFDEVWLHFFID